MSLDKKILLKEYKDQIKGYGFLKDLINGTLYGLTEKEARQYRVVWEEFEEDPSLPKYMLNVPNVEYKEIPRGTLRVYGIKEEE